MNGGQNESGQTNVNGIITKIERQKRNMERYNIFVQGEYAFSVHEDVLISQRLLKGKEIDVNEMKQILAEEQRRKAERAALHYLSYRPRTVQEMCVYLKGKEIEPNTITEIIDKLLKEEYLNDLQFALTWVNERLTMKMKGPYVLREELKQKGISTSIIQQALEQIEQEEQFEACFQLAEKKWRQIQNRFSDSHEQRQRLMIHLQRRGFSFDVIQAVVHRMEES